MLLAAGAIADEPTASLDTTAKDEAHTFLAEVSRDVPVVVVSHDARTRDNADRVVFMRDGKLQAIGSEESGMAQVSPDHAATS